MTLTKWLEHIHLTHDRAMDFRLDRLIDFAKALNLLPVDYYVITVGGTNGKGTAATLLSHILQNAGAKIGLFTSPHLLCYNERIAINGQIIDDASLCAAFEIVEKMRNRLQAKLTEFEFVFFAALIHFKQIGIDIAIFEVGLGGRLDAVNIIDTNLAIITSIGIDHVAYLGDNRESIATEKAGIFRQGVPVICGDPSPPQTLLDHAYRLKCPLFRVNQDFHYEKQNAYWQWQDEGHKLEQLSVPNIPIENAATALMASYALSINITITPTHIEKALSECHVRGRLEHLKTLPSIILDVAHNEPAAHYLATHLAENKPVRGKTLAVFSALEDKNIKKIVKAMENIVDTWHVAPLNVPRCASSTLLSNAFN